MTIFYEKYVGFYELQICTLEGRIVMISHIADSYNWGLSAIFYQFKQRQVRWKLKLLNCICMQ
ncbi:hypothetical protein HW555_006616 [Spodoptera exigua]|uniref:Uncharacterized protein n=1 Tax=Spodoptera exigua TaxID=7107 RepID=A0A835GHU2_SPOEX|nr:hypothetical protein HW555_006616 [Spodoptera exigua]